MLDYTNYQKQTLLSESMACWQGPSILIYNNSTFSDNDWRRYLPHLILNADKN
jgi:hypothetical protein